MEAKRLDRLETTAPMDVNPISTVPPTILREKTPDFTYVPTADEVEFLVKHDPVIKRKAIDLIADMTLTEEQRTAQLKDFIEMNNETKNVTFLGVILSPKSYVFGLDFTQSHFFSHFRYF